MLQSQSGSASGLGPRIPRIRGGPNSGPLTAERTTTLFSFYCPIRIRENGKRRGNSHFCSTLHFFLLLRRRCSYNTTTTKIHCHFEGGGGVPNFFPFCCLFLLISHSQKLSDFPTTLTCPPLACTELFFPPFLHTRTIGRSI